MTAELKRWPAPDNRVFNFAAGPAVMPRPVLEAARDELLDWRGRGHSVWELPFTGADYKRIAAEAQADLRALLNIPADYEVLFMHGGASAQFSVVPLNLLDADGTADYVMTGHWAKKAIVEARRFGAVSVVAEGPEGFTALPARESWKLNPDADYCHITANETGDGLEYHWTPETGETPLVADMTSNILSRPFDVSRYGLIYAGAQKNIGPAGLCVVIVRRDLVGRARRATPSVFDYQVQIDTDGRFNTPLTYAVYLAGLVFDWLKAEGGVAAMARAAERKSGKLYRAIDGGDFYHCPVAIADRSRMNVCFGLAEPSLEPLFLTEAEAHGLVNLKGHAAIGGIRASLYNAMPEAGVDALVEFMADFAQRRARGGAIS
jgi:phosphoserine aminotransferase